MQDDVQMYIKLPDYDEFRGLDISNDMDIAAIPKKNSTGPQKTAWITIKHRLFNAHVPKKMFNAIRENEMSDKTGEFKQERLFRKATKIPISKTPDDLGGLIL